MFYIASLISCVGAPRDLYASVDPRTKKRRPPSSPGGRGTRTRSADPASLLGPLASLELRTGKARADRDSRVDSGSVDLGTPLELSPKSPLEQLDEALDAVMPTASFTGISSVLILARTLLSRVPYSSEPVRVRECEGVATLCEGAGEGGEGLP